MDPNRSINYRRKIGPKSSTDGGKGVCPREGIGLMKGRNTVMPGPCSGKNLTSFDLILVTDYIQKRRGQFFRPNYLQILHFLVISLTLI
jgi:hypothetical protein